MRLKTRLVKDPYRVKIMPPVQLVVMTLERKLDRNKRERPSEDRLPRWPKNERGEFHARRSNPSGDAQALSQRNFQGAALQALPHQQARRQVLSGQRGDPLPQQRAGHP